MTDMRDARFQKALQEAPDADVRPAVQVSQAILAAAHNALPASPPLPVTPTPATQGTWWKRLWESVARPAAPWSAAFATVLVAVLVTVMWVHDPALETRPVADAAPPATAPVAAPPIAAPAVAEAKSPAIAAATPSPVEQSRSALAKTAPEPPLEERKLAAEKASAAEAAEVADTQARTYRADMARAVAPSVPSLAAAPAAPAAPAADVTPSAALPAAKVAAPAAMARSGANTSGLGGWTALQVQMAGHSAVVDRARGQKLYAAMLQLARQLPAAAGMPTAMPATEPVMRLTVVSQGETLAVMALWDSVALWQRPSNDDVIASVSGAEIQALLQLARQALGAEPVN